MTPSWTTHLTDYLPASLTETQLATFGLYLNEIIDWNARLNLTAIREPDEIRVKHFFDSLTIARGTGDLNGKTLVDVGTGAGFPGIPLKIAFPDLKLTLIDSVGKKLKFCEQLCAKLNLRDVSIVHARAEDAGQDSNLRESFDYAVARAVTVLPVLCEYLLPLVKVGGAMIAQKNAACDHEIRAVHSALPLLGAESAEKIALHLPYGLGDRALVRIRKTSMTAPAYPRQAGTPKRAPLGDPLE